MICAPGAGRPAFRAGSVGSERLKAQRGRRRISFSHTQLTNRQRRDNLFASVINVSITPRIRFVVMAYGNVPIGVQVLCSGLPTTVSRANHEGKLRELQVHIGGKFEDLASMMDPFRHSPGFQNSEGKTNRYKRRCKVKKARPALPEPKGR